MLDSPDNLFLGIRSHLLDRHVGNVKIGSIDKNHGLGAIGIIIGNKEARGKGLGGLAINMMLEIARIKFFLRKITACCYVPNIHSQRVFEKNGFSVEAVWKQHYLLNGKPEDVVLMSKDLE